MSISLTHRFIPLSKLILSVLIDLRLLVFMVLCLVLGGTSQDIGEPKLPLYIISLMLIGWSAFSLNKNNRIWKAKSLVAFALAFLLIHLIYLIPLPPSIWENISGRETVSEGFVLLEMGVPWLPLSLTPERTFFTLFDLLPPLAMLLAMSTFVTKKEVKIAIWGILIFAILTVVLGILQITESGENLFFYAITNRKLPVGFFSNVNHQASFLLMALPLAIAFFASSVRGHKHGVGTKQLVLAFSVVACAFYLIGILFTKSLAGYFLLIPTLLGPLFFCVFKSSEKQRYFVLFSILVGVGIVCDYLFLGNNVGAISYEVTNLDETSRKAIFARTLDISKNFFPFGTGPGSFDRVYLLFEGTLRNAETIPHVHNEYLEILLEFGLIGVIFASVFCAWLAKRIFGIFRSQRSHLVFAKCASFSVLSILVHSIVDYPMRTIGLSTLFVFCLCIVILPLRLSDT